VLKDESYVVVFYSLIIFEKGVDRCFDRTSCLFVCVIMIAFTVVVGCWARGNRAAEPTRIYLSLKKLVDWLCSVCAEMP
jgi:F0F1-type ATP synthase membrane subunit a